MHSISSKRNSQSNSTISTIDAAATSATTITAVFTQGSVRESTDHDWQLHTQFAIPQECAFCLLNTPLSDLRLVYVLKSFSPPSSVGQLG